MNRLINMAVRMFMRRGINGAINMAARRGKPAQDMTAQDRATARNAQQTTQRARRSLGLLRRFMR